MIIEALIISIPLSCAIYFGLKTPNTDKDNIKQWLKRNDKASIVKREDPIDEILKDITK